MDPGPERDKLAIQYRKKFETKEEIAKWKHKFLEEDIIKKRRIIGDFESKGKKEKDIENEIIEFLFRNKIEHWPIKIKGEVQSIGNGRAILKKSKNSGFPDILCCFNGLFIGIEVKIYKGIQSEDQILTQNRIEKAQGLYFIVTSVKELKQRLTEERLGSEWI
jgi:hypothetical protein